MSEEDGSDLKAWQNILIYLDFTLLIGCYITMLLFILFNVWNYLYLQKRYKGNSRVQLVTFYLFAVLMTVFRLATLMCQLFMSDPKRLAFYVSLTASTFKLNLG